MTSSNRHVSTPLMRRYVGGDSAMADDALWAIETHLESCPSCRDCLRLVVAEGGRDTQALLTRVHDSLSAAAVLGAQMPTRRAPRWASPWTPPGLWPRLAVTVAMVVTALVLDVAHAWALPIVALVAPVAPMIGVAAVWSAGTDPAHELVVASPRAGLYMVLRRTLAVLVVVIPALTVAGWISGAAPALWLLPCLAFTAGALALGQVIGLHRAAGVLTLAWAAGVVVPSVLTAHSPLVLDPSSLPYWAGLAAACVAALALRRRAYTGMRS